MATAAGRWRGEKDNNCVAQLFINDREMRLFSGSS